MSDSIFILGRQPALGRAELESLFGSDRIRVLGNGVALQLARDPANLAFERLGGSLKLAKLLTVLPYRDWASLVGYVTKTLPAHLQYVPPGKLTFGMSAYNLPVKPDHLNRGSLMIKKAVRQHRRPVRVVPNKEPALNSAKVLHNNLTGPGGMELLFIGHGRETILAQTVRVQDIAAYGARDQTRPKRDTQKGMLPPKLAQLIINLAYPKDEGTVLDPFCGTGVVLQEALLMGLSAYGTDVDERMVSFSRENVIEWLLNDDDTGRVHIEYGDATSHQWDYPFDTVASETYLGRPFAAPPGPEALQAAVQDVNTIVKKFLGNLAAQTPPGFRMCLALPAWKTHHGFKRLPLLDRISDLGYNRVSFVHANNDELVYHRPNQLVARELVTLIRK